VKSDTGVLASGGTTNVGDVKTGASQTLTQTLGGNGITKASQIAIVFNADEPSGNSVTLTGLQMSIFNGNTDIFDAHLAASVTFPTTFTGIGNQGFVFRLNSAEAATLQGLLTPLSSTDLAALRIGLSASASDATGGPETFNLATITAVAEPGTLPFVGTALVGLGGLGAEAAAESCRGLTRRVSANSSKRAAGRAGARPVVRPTTPINGQNTNGCFCVRWTQRW
jgi:hypothetical protein